MNVLIGLEIREVKRFLECLKPETILCPGFGNPHPYRANYMELALAPKITTTVRELLEDLNRAQTVRLKLENGTENNYIFEDHCSVLLASPGHYGRFLTMDMLLMSVEGWVKIGEGFGRTH